MTVPSVLGESPVTGCLLFAIFTLPVLKNATFMLQTLTQPQSRDIRFLSFFFSKYLKQVWPTLNQVLEFCIPMAALNV